MYTYVDSIHVYLHTRKRSRTHSILSSDWLVFFLVARFKKSNCKIELTNSICKTDLLNTVTDAWVSASVWYFAYS